MTQPSTPHPFHPYYYTSTFNAFATIFQKEGWKALYKGLGPSLFGVSHVMVQFPLYEMLLNQANEFSNHSTPSIDFLPSTHSSLSATASISVSPEPAQNIHIIFASALSKSFASLATYPHEVIRTKLQTQTSFMRSKETANATFRSSLPSLPSSTSLEYRGLLHTLTCIWKEEGLKGLYKGFGTNLIR